MPGCTRRNLQMQENKMESSDNESMDSHHSRRSEPTSVQRNGNPDAEVKPLQCHYLFILC